MDEVATSPLVGGSMMKCELVMLSETVTLATLVVNWGVPLKVTFQLLVSHGPLPSFTGEVNVEVVLTPLDVEGMPLLRFATGDISFLIEEPCSCGRTAPRLGPILGRKQQLMKIRGTSVYPQAVFNALDELAGVGDYYLELRTNAERSEELVVHLAETARLPSLEMIAEHLQAWIRVTPIISVDPEDKVRHHLYSPESRKPVRVVDRRA